MCGSMAAEASSHLVSPNPIPVSTSTGWKRWAMGTVRDAFFFNQSALIQLRKGGRLTQ